MESSLLRLTPAIVDSTMKARIHCISHGLSGFTSLPDNIVSDILALVMEVQREGCGVKSPSISPVAFSHVCRRFRVVALSNPKHWCDLSSGFPPPMALCYLTRAKMNPLHISLLKIKGQDISISATVSLLIGASQSWKRLSISKLAHNDWVCLTNRYRYLLFPQLVEVHLVSLGFHFQGLPDGWSTPVLRSMQTFNSYTSEPLLACITSCSIILEVPKGAWLAWDLSNMRYLRLPAEIQHLRFIFKPFPFTQPMLEGFGQMRLEHLNHLVLQFTGEGDWAAFQDKFELPQLETLSCHALQCTVQGAMNLLQSLRRNASFSRLRGFSFVYTPAPSAARFTESQSTLLDEMVESMTSLEDLHVNIQNLSQYLSHIEVVDRGTTPFSTCHSLKSCFLDGVRSPSTSYLACLLRHIRSAPCYTNFRMLGIRLPAGMDVAQATQTARSILEGRNIVYWINR